MSDGGGGGQPPAAAASDFVEAEAAEDKEDGAGAQEEEDEDADDDGADLKDFITNEAEGGAAAKKAGGGEDASSSSSEEDDTDKPITQGDIDDLADLGLDVSNLQARQRDRPQGDAGDQEPKKKKARKDKKQDAAESKEDLERQLFGSGDESADDGDAVDAKEAKVQLDPADGKDDDADFFADLSDDEDVDNFIVEEPGAAKRRRKEEAGELDITDEQLKDIVDIFGDTSVLRSLDQIRPEEEEGLPEKKPRPDREMEGLISRGEEIAEDGATTAAEPMDEEPREFEGDADVDPDLRAKLYQTKEDSQLEVRDLPERWYQAYCRYPELTDRDGSRRWKDEEHQCEKKWLVLKDWDLKNLEGRPKVEASVLQILQKLHAEKLEPVYIVFQHAFEYGEQFKEEELWRICDLDLQWQGIWALRTRLIDWKQRIEDVGKQLPEHINEQLKSTIFDTDDPDPETVLKDLYDWFCANHMDSALDTDAKKAQSTSARLISLAREEKLDRELGVDGTNDENGTLRLFGITPEQLGDNVAQNKQVHAPLLNEDRNGVEISASRIIREHRSSKRLEKFNTEGEAKKGNFDHPEQVKEVILLLLSRLIACEPRVRSYVRKEFWRRCAISTEVTQTGKSVAHNASHTFRPSYRACHLVNRPITTIHRTDELFLDVMKMVKEGFIRLEYSFIIPEEEGFHYKYVILGHEEADTSKDRQKIFEHFRRQDAEGDFLPKDEGERAKWNWCTRMVPRLKAALRAQECQIRRAGAENELEKVQELFKVAGMNFSHDDINKMIAPDPIFDHLLQMYSALEQQGEDLYFRVPGEWNNIRKLVIFRACRDELYPMLWNEVQNYLAKAAEAEVCRQCAANLEKKVDIQPYRLTEAKIIEDRTRYRIVNKKDVNEQDDASDDEDRDEVWKREKKLRVNGYCSVLVVAADAASDQCYLAMVNGFGDPIDMRRIFKTFHDKPIEARAKGGGKGMKQPPPEGSHMWLKEQKRLEHREVFKNLLRKHKPAVVLLPVIDKLGRMPEHIREIIDDNEMAINFRSKPEVLYGDPTVPRVVAYHHLLKQENGYVDLQNPLQRIALSSARFLQNPLAEVCQLWHEKPELNELLRIKLHRLQGAVPEERLGQALLKPLLRACAQAGFNVNQARRSRHLAKVAYLLPGLGPRKARIFQKCLADRVTSRESFARVFQKHLQRKPTERNQQSPVVANLLPFLKICPDARDQWQLEEVRGIDRTRLGQCYDPWLKTLCKATLEKFRELNPNDDDIEVIDGDPVTTVVQAFSRDHLETTMTQTMNSLNLDPWKIWAAKIQGKPDKHYEQTMPFIDLDKLMRICLAELKTPFEDKRAIYENIGDAEVFYLMLGDSESNLSRGSMVHCKVQQDQQYPDFVVEEEKKDDDKKKDDNYKVEVIIQPDGSKGSFWKMRKRLKGKDSGGQALEEGFIDGCERHFQKNERVLARVENVMPEKNKLQLSVDRQNPLWLECFTSIISEQDSVYFVPLPDEDWSKAKLGLAEQSQEKKDIIMLQKQIKRPRNIKHANWLTGNTDHSVQVMDKYPLANVLFRGSQRYNMIVAMLKVRPTLACAGPDVDREDCVDAKHCFRTFDVLEKVAKNDSTGFELAPEVEVDNMSYKDFDEVIALHMDPISERLRLMQDDRHYGMQDGEVTDREQIKNQLRSYSKEQPKKLDYVFLHHHSKVGHILMLWAFHGHLREEMVEVHPQHYALWGEPFETLAKMVEWFKPNCRKADELRRKWREDSAKKKEQAAEKRGKDAFEGAAPKKAFQGFDTVAGTRLGGLQTPIGAAGTPTVYTKEAAAGTPSGMRTPMGGMNPMSVRASGLASPAPMTAGAFNPATPDGRAPGTPGLPGGYRAPPTPDGRAPGTPGMIPGTPGMRRAPPTPDGRTPGTPGALMSAPGTPAQQRTQGAAFQSYRGAPPGTPAGYPPGAPGSRASVGPAVPSTPAELLSLGPGGQRLPAPSTPAGAYGQQRYVPAPSTPAAAFAAGPAPGTAGSARSFPGPGAASIAPGSRQSVGTFQAGAPQSVQYNPGTPGMPGMPAAMTPAARAPPGTPAGVYAAAGTPAGISPAGSAPPQTPAGVFQQPGTPAGPPPRTPAPGGLTTPKPQTRG